MQLITDIWDEGLPVDNALYVRGCYRNFRPVEHVTDPDPCIGRTLRPYVPWWLELIWRIYWLSTGQGMVDQGTYFSHVILFNFVLFWDTYGESARRILALYCWIKPRNSNKYVVLIEAIALKKIICTVAVCRNHGSLRKQWRILFLKYLIIDGSISW